MLEILKQKQKKFTRDDYIFLANMSLEAERYDEMVTYVNKFANVQGELLPEERNLMALAYKSAISNRRAEIIKLSEVNVFENRKLVDKSQK